MKFSGKVCFKIISKVTKNQGFTLFLGDIFFEKLHREGGQFNTPGILGLKFYYFFYAQMLILKIQLTAFTNFKISSKLNFLCCNYVHFSQQLSFLCFFFFSSLLSNNIHVPTGNKLFIQKNINFLMIKMITKLCEKQEKGLIKGWIVFKEFFPSDYWKFGYFENYNNRR